MSARELVHLSATAMAEAVRARRVRATDLLEAHLTRIAELDPQLNAFRVVLTESARAEARAIDARASDRSEAPLLGVPVAIKDTIDVRGVASMMGTASAQPLAREDAEVVARLRAAGAIILGKTHLPELAAWPFTSSRTWGRTKNPWQLDRDPGGSSGGSAVAVAAHMAGLALGDDLGGSIRVPAACTGLFGLKPQVDRAPTAPHVGRVEGLGTYGPLARTVGDAALALEVLSGTQIALPTRRLTIGVSMDTALGVRSEEAARRLDDASALLASLGHSVRAVSIPYRSALPLAFFLRYFAGLAAEFEDLVQPERTEPRSRTLARVGRQVPGWARRWAKEESRRQARAMDALFERIDVLLTPMLAGPAMQGGAHDRRGLISTLWNVAQYTPYAALANLTGAPACAVPMGLDAHGLPIAVQLMGRRDDEATLLGLASELEQRRPFPTLDAPQLGPQPISAPLAHVP